MRLEGRASALESKPLPLRSWWRLVAGFVSKTITLAELEARRLRHDPTELITRAAQPALWLVVFG